MRPGDFNVLGVSGEVVPPVPLVGPIEGLKPGFHGVYDGRSLRLSIADCDRLYPNQEIRVTCLVDHLDHDLLPAATRQLGSRMVDHGRLEIEGLGTPRHEEIGAPGATGHLRVTSGGKAEPSVHLVQVELPERTVELSPILGAESGAQVVLIVHWPVDEPLVEHRSHGLGLGHIRPV